MARLHAIGNTERSSYRYRIVEPHFPFFLLSLGCISGATQFMAPSKIFPLLFHFQAGVMGMINKAQEASGLHDMTFKRM